MFEIPAGDILKVHSRYNGAPLSRLNEIKARNECENVHKNYKTFAATIKTKLRFPQGVQILSRATVNQHF